MPETNERQLIQLAPNDLQLFEQVSVRYDAVIAQGVTPEDLLVPGFWAHHAVKLQPMSEIRARAADGTWLAYYVVVDCSRTWAKVRLLSMHQLSSSDVSLTQASADDIKAFVGAHSVVWRAQHKFSIVRNADKAVIMEGIQLKDEAIAWLQSHARAQVGGPPSLPKPAVVTA